MFGAYINKPTNSRTNKRGLSPYTHNTTRERKREAIVFSEKKENPKPK